MSPSSPNPSQTSPARVLVADDEPGIRAVLQWALSNEGHEVVVTEDGQQAVEASRTKEFHVAFVDMTMPGIGGIEAIAQLRQTQPRCRVVLMSGYSQAGDIRAALRAGAYTTINKPFEIDKIMDILQDCLDSRPAALIVHGEEPERRRLSAFFQEKGWVVEETSSRETAIPMVLNREFHLALLDVSKSNGDGLETLRQVKDFRPQLSVAVITRDGDRTLAKEAERFGSFAALSHPLDISRLSDLMDRCLPRP